MVENEIVKGNIKEIKIPFRTLKRIIKSKIPEYRVEKDVVDRLNDLLIETLTITLMDAKKFPERYKRKTLTIEDVELALRP